jgi:hypothetical protein
MNQPRQHLCCLSTPEQLLVASLLHCPGLVFSSAAEAQPDIYLDLRRETVKLSNFYPSPLDTYPNQQEVELRYWQKWV